MPLESNEVLLEKEKIQSEFEKQFGGLLEEIDIDGANSDILTNEDKFSLIIRKTNNLIKFAGNKFIYYLQTSNNNKLDYISIDDYSQEAKIILWNIIEENPKKPLTEILKIFKTALWRITICYFRKSNLKKNLGADVHINTELANGECITIEDSFDNIVFSQGGNNKFSEAHNDIINNIDREDLKENFLKYIIINLSKKDVEIFKMIIRPKLVFIKHCYKSCYAKKKKHKNIINKSNIASYLNRSMCYVDSRMESLTKAFSKFKEIYGR